jgi:hypothetical protein
MREGISSPPSWLGACWAMCGWFGLGWMGRVLLRGGCPLMRIGRNVWWLDAVAARAWQGFGIEYKPAERHLSIERVWLAIPSVSLAIAVSCVDDCL